MSVTTATRPAGAPSDDAPGDKTGKGGKARSGSKRKLLVILLVLVLAGAGAWFFVLAPKGDGGPVPGEVMPIDPIQINLADDHYLRVGIALQLVEGADKADGSKALDALIDLFSGRQRSELTRPAGREKLKKQLEHLLEQRYDGEVMGVYFTEFVSQ
jgi:flagellar FliL protein